MEDKKTEARARYITGTESLKTLAEAMGISENRMEKWSQEGKWSQERRNYRRKTGDAAVKAAMKSEVKRLAILMKANRSMERALELAAKEIESELKKTPGLVIDGKFRGGNMRNVAETLQRVTENAMLLSGIMPAEKKEQLRLLREKQALEERKEAQRTQDAGDVKIVMEAEVEEMAE